MIGSERFGRPVSARAAAARSGPPVTYYQLLIVVPKLVHLMNMTASLSAQASARSAATAPAVASNKVGHPPVGFEVRAGTQVTQVAGSRAVQLAAVQKLTGSASEF